VRSRAPGHRRCESKKCRRLCRPFPSRSRQEISLDVNFLRLAGATPPSAHVPGRRWTLAVESETGFVVTVTAADSGSALRQRFVSPQDECPRKIRPHRPAFATGKKAMYAFNLIGDVEEMKRRHDVLVKHGATCLMASLNSVGLAGMIELAKFSKLPIHAHRNGWGYLSRYPMLGWSFVAWHKVWRLADADHMHVNGLANKFSESDESVVEAARACLTPMFSDKPCIVMPVFSPG
jgi:hypothetical protein